MNLIPPRAVPGPIEYPESDGERMSDNTKQSHWILLLYANIDALFHDRSDVFVAADFLWYPVEGHPEVRVAPDVAVALGRPKGHRGSYKQWEEDDVPLTIVFEILSPNNKPIEMADKLAFYEEYGVEEYYLYDPDTNSLAAYIRRGELLLRVRPVAGFVSPRMGIRFDFTGPEMVVRYPDGEPFRTVAEMEVLLQHEREQRLAAEQRVTRLERLTELSRKARRGQASAEELTELERLEEQT